MKKSILIVSVLCLAFVSCKKKSDYTCTCSVPGSTLESTSQLTDITEEDAKVACDNGTTVATAVCVLSEN